MPLVELSLLSAAIVEATGGAVLSGAQRREAVIRILKRAKLDPKRPPDDFDALYAYTLVEYGVGKPLPILELFRNAFIKQAFRESFTRGDPSILNREAEEIITWYEETGKLAQLFRVGAEWAGAG